MYSWLIALPRRAHFSYAVDEYDMSSHWVVDNCDPAVSIFKPEKHNANAKH